MTKHELIAAIAEGAGITKTDAAKALDATTTAIQSALAKGDSVTLIGFGSFSVKDRAERIGRNPRTGEEITIAAAKIPSFKAGSALKEAVSQK